MCLSLIGCASNPAKLSADGPVFNPITYLNGVVEGQGVVYNWRGKVMTTYDITMTGTLQPDGSLSVVEDYVFADGKTKTDTLTYAQTSENTFTSASPYFPKGAKAKSHGNLVNWRYNYRFPLSEGENPKTIMLHMNDYSWLLQDGKTVFDEIRLSKFGVPVGRIVMVLKKAK